MLLTLSLISLINNTKVKGKTMSLLACLVFSVLIFLDAGEIKEGKVNTETVFLNF